jgi:hypothetical protein
MTSSLCFDRNIAHEKREKTGQVAKWLSQHTEHFDEILRVQQS